MAAESPSAASALISPREQKFFHGEQKRAFELGFC